MWQAILRVATRTVMFHKCNIMDKVGLRTTADLTQYAIRSGLITIEMPGSNSVIENTTSTRSKAIGVATFSSQTPFGRVQAAKMHAR